MAYREFGMVEVREILRRWLGGEGIRAIARGAGVDRKTIAAYVQAAVGVGVQRGGAPPTDEQLAAIATARRPGRPGNASAPSPELEVLRPQESTIRQWLAEGLRLTKIYRRLRAEGVHVSYSSLYRFARVTCEFGTPAITVRMADPPPGEVAETDFGVLGYVPHPVFWTTPRLMVDRACERVVEGNTDMATPLVRVDPGASTALGFREPVHRGRHAALHWASARAWAGVR